ncbi:hypothetical protein BB558_004896 [Smittium angustum]|nr:hypothetical protein BB558_004896 [Smittium angustum]
MARQHGYRARSSFKLLHLLNKYPLLNLPSKSLSPANQTVVIECGSAPGGWSQVLSHVLYSQQQTTRTSPETLSKPLDQKLPDSLEKILSAPFDYNRVISVDILEMVPVEGVDFICGDFTNPIIKQEITQKIGSRKVGLILSDMAPNLSGNRLVDDSKSTASIYHSLELCLDVLRFAENYLDKDGSLVLKYFMGQNHTELRNLLRKRFAKVHSEKPPSSRKESSEQYFVATGYLANK